MASGGARRASRDPAAVSGEARPRPRASPVPPAPSPAPRPARPPPRPAARRAQAPCAALGASRAPLAGSTWAPLRPLPGRRTIPKRPEGPEDLALLAPGFRRPPLLGPSPSPLPYQDAPVSSKNTRSDSLSQAVSGEPELRCLPGARVCLAEAAELLSVSGSNGHSAVLV